jgi:hypothetical protein
MRLKKTTILSFLALLTLGFTLAFQVTVKAQTPALISPSSCSLSPVEQTTRTQPVTRLDKSGKLVTEGSQTIKENKPIALKLSSLTTEHGDLRSVSLGDRIRVTIKGLSTAIDRGLITAFDQERQTSTLQPFNFQSLVLQLNGYSLGGMQGTYISPNQIEFQLTHFEDSHRAWTGIFGNALNETRQATVTIGCPNGGAIALDSTAQTQNPQFNQITIRLWQSLRGLIILIPILVLMISVWISLQGSILRDIGVTHNRTYSLSRAQLAWWSYIVFFSFLVLFSITGDYTNIVTSQAMVLLGLGAATTVGATVIDSGAERTLSREQETLLLQLDRELLHIKAELKQETKGSHSWRELMNTKEEIEREISQYERQSKGFFRDLLAGENGEVNLHRYQIFIWTIVLGLIFIYEIIVSFKMPEFDTTLLTLQGISAGTYLTLKAQGESDPNNRTIDPRVALKRPAPTDLFQRQAVSELDPGKIPNGYASSYGTANLTRVSNPDQPLEQVQGQSVNRDQGVSSSMDNEDITEITRRVLDPDQ